MSKRRFNASYNKMAMLGLESFTISIASRATVESRARAGDGNSYLCMNRLFARTGFT